MHLDDFRIARAEARKLRNRLRPLRARVKAGTVSDWPNHEDRRREFVRHLYRTGRLTDHPPAITRGRE